MESSIGRNRGDARGWARIARAALITLAIATSTAGAAFAANGARDAAGSPDAFVRSDEAERLVLALESAQAELEHAAATREEVAAARAANNPLRIAREWLSAAASNTQLLAGAGVVGGVLIGMALVTGLQGTAGKRRKPPVARRSAAPAATAPPPREETVQFTPAAARAREAEPENVWAKILRLSSAGMSGEEISRVLGASADDINLVLGLQRRRVEIAGALGQASMGRAKAAGR